MCALKGRNCYRAAQNSMQNSTYSKRYKALKALGEASDMSNLARVTALRRLVCGVRATPLRVRDECVARVKIVRFLILEKIAA